MAMVAKDARRRYPEYCAWWADPKTGEAKLTEDEYVAEALDKCLVLEDEKVFNLHEPGVDIVRWPLYRITPPAGEKE